MLAERLLSERLHRQRLTGEQFADPVQGVSWFGGVQSQDFAAALWGVGQRCAGSTEASIRRLFDDGAILRTHVLRPTWHFVAPADLRWMLALTASRVHVLNGPYYRRHDLDDRQLHRAAEVITAALQGRQLTRAELGAALASGGIAAEGLRLGLIVMWCELEALICSGAVKGRQHTYALVDERVGAAASREPDDALGELATRYFTSHGPALLTDFVWWSGLKVREARRAVQIAADRLRHLTLGEQEFISGADAASSPPAKGVHLLPAFDEFVVAYRDRAALLAPDEQGSIPLDAYLVLVDGQMAGTWKRTVQGRHVSLRMQLSPTYGSAAGGIAAQSERFGQFLGLPVKID